MRSMRLSEFLELASRWQQDSSALWVLFACGGESDSFASAVKTVGNASFTLAKEGKKDVSVELLPGTTSWEGLPSEASSDLRGESISRFERVVELRVPTSAGPAVFAIFEIKAQ